MRYSTGCAFTLTEMFMNFPFKKLKITCKETYEIIKDNHRLVLAKRIFRDCLYMIINDIIDNNVTFWLPVYGIRECNIHMRRIGGNAFKYLRQYGKWEGLDFVNSGFTGYQMSIYLLGKRTPRVKSVYLNPELRDKIIDNTNKGMQYGDGKTDTYLKDYLDRMNELYPTVPKCDIKRILHFGWRSLYLHNSYGGDTIIKNPLYWCYIGNLKRTPLDHFKYYIRKLSIRLRVLQKRKKIPWDGYYYFALTNNQYDKYINLKKRRGRPKKHFTFEHAFLYRVLDECKIRGYGRRYIFRIPYITEMKNSLYFPELKTDKAELFLVRDTLKFKDIMTWTNKYEAL